MELTSPAGSKEKLFYAINFGADAVYCGSKQFNLRAKGDNFTFDELKEATNFCHTKGKKIYITVNIFAHNRDFEGLKKLLIFLEKTGVDAVIISDIGVLSLCKEFSPSIPIHISTQANVSSLQSAEMWLSLGAKRVILARELSLAEISEIKSKLPELELEIFVHGAMCIAYSGRCLMSAFLNNRFANRGECSHVCRWNFAVTEKKRNGQYFDINEDDYGSYIMNSKDLCLVQEIPKIMESGVDSIKIEGRMKSNYYVANTTRIYKKALILAKENIQQPQKLIKELKKVSHRPYTKGFLFPELDETTQNYSSSSYIKTYQYLGNVIGQKKNYILVKVKAKFLLGDKIEIISPELEKDFKMVVKKIIQLGESDKKVSFTKPNTIVMLPLQKKVPNFAILRKRN